MKPQSESQIQQQIIQYFSLICNQYNFVYMAPMNEGVMMVLKMFRVPDEDCYKIVSYLKKMGFRKGASDLQIFHQGRALFMELKTQEGELSKDQKLFRDKVLKAECEYAVVRSLDQAKECLELWGVMV